jgi:uncharacterized membrane protein YoaK (UPF0700 family)
MPIAIRLAHADRKASSQAPWDGGQLIAPDLGGWQPLAPSAVAHGSDEPPLAVLDLTGPRAPGGLGPVGASIAAQTRAHERSHLRQQETMTEPVPQHASLLSINLAFVTGYVDTVGFVALFGLFTAHVTGNFVLIGSVLAYPSGSVLLKLLAFPAFIGAVALTRLIVLSLERRNRDPLAPLLLLQCVLLGGFASLGWMATPILSADESLAIWAGLAGVAATGVQNAAARLVLASLAPTTVMTGNVTARDRRRRSAARCRRRRHASTERQILLADRRIRNRCDRRRVRLRACRLRGVADPDPVAVGLGACLPAGPDLFSTGLTHWIGTWIRIGQPESDHPD